MTLLVEVYNAAGNRLGDGPIRTARAASVTRVLDGVGSFTLDLPGTDSRVLDLLQPKRRVRVYLWDDQGNKRELVRGIVEQLGAKDDSSGWVLTCDGPDNMAELKFTSVLLGRKYDADTVQDIIDDLLGLTSGWTRGTGNVSVLSARLDGVSVLKAIQSICQQQGIHFRQDTTIGTLQIGALGFDSGLTLVNPVNVYPGLIDNDDILLIEDFTKLESSEDMVNWLLPVGAGEGDAMVSLQHSTRSSPYTIQNLTGPDGRTLYYISDSASVTEYGTIQKVGKFSDIKPIGTSAANVTAAANALYDIAAAWLQRYKDPYESYSITVRKPRENIRPGNKLHVRYKGVVETSSGTLTYVDVDSDMWIMEVTETYGPRGVQVKLKVASVDRYEQDNAEVVIGALEDLRLNNVSVRSYLSHYTYADYFEIDSSNDAVFKLDVTNAVQAIYRVILRLETTPFTATAAGAASGGGATSGSGGGSTPTTTATPHQHTWASIPSSPPGTGGWANRIFSISDGSNIYFFEALSNHPLPGSTKQLFALNENPSHTHNVTVPNHTHTVPNHTHDLDYGLHKDTDYPDTVSITVNGNSVASNVDPSGTGIDAEYDITARIVNEATLQKSHVITISCGGGQGIAKVTLDVVEVIQSISVFS